MPRIVAVDPRLPAANAVAEAVAVLRAGGLVGLPTETVYGLGADALDEAAVARIFLAKGRPEHHPLIVHVVREVDARRLAASWPENASRLARAFWPGPLTLVVDRAAHVPSIVAGGGTSIALRAPSHAVARAVIESLGDPVAAPSANRYQGLSPTTAAHVVKQLGDKVDLVLDAGACDAGIESTVVDVRGGRAHVLRPGAIGLAALRAIVPGVEARVEHAHGEDARASPGMDARHYAPRARLRLAATREEAARLATSLSMEGERAALVVFGAEASAPAHGVLVRALPRDPASYAHLIYGTLHDLDDEGATVIVVERVPDGDVWWAVADRLHRAASP